MLLKKNDKIIRFFWWKIGGLKILFGRNQSATLQFTPSRYARRKGLAQALGRSIGRGRNDGNT